MLVASIATTLDTASAAEQSYPTRPIRFIIPYAPGGGLDLIGRIIGQRLSEALGKPVIIDNRAGAGGIVGSELGARAVPDGYTLTMGNNSTLSINQVINPKLSYDSTRDFAPISTLVTSPHLLIAGNAVPAKTLKEFIALAKSKPGQFSFGSAGAQTHLAAELFRYTTGLQLAHIPYNSSSAVLLSLMRGETSIYFAPSAGTIPHIQGGRVKALGITSVKRSLLLPDVPTMSEHGIADFESGVWFVLLAPSRTPKPIVDRLNQEVVKIVNTDYFRQRAAAEGVDPVGSTPQESVQLVRGELAKWSKLVKEAGVRVE